MLVHEGPARIFESDEEATEAIKTGKINPGDVIVIRYEGTKRRSGNAWRCSIRLRRLQDIDSAPEVALITDGRFSGASRGASIGHVSPGSGGGRRPIALVERETLYRLIFRIYL